MRHYLRLAGLYLRAAVQREMAQRANLAINLLNTTLNLGAGLAGVAILFGQVETIRGWAFPQALALLGVYLLVGALRDLCIGPSLDSLGGLGGDVFQGSFDFTLLKPAPAQFLVSCRAWRPWALGDLALSLGVLLLPCEPAALRGRVELREAGERNHGRRTPNADQFAGVLRIWREKGWL